MAKARAIVKRRKAVKNITKITRTMQMISTAKFQKSLKRATGTKPYTQKVRELVQEVAASIGDVDHPLLRRVTPENRTDREAVVVLTSDRGLAGAYNGNVMKLATQLLDELKNANQIVDLYVAGKKGVSMLTFQGRTITQQIKLGDPPTFENAEPVISKLMKQFVDGEIDSVSVVYMNFISTGVQRPEVTTLLPLAGVDELMDRLARDAAERDHQLQSGVLDAKAHEKTPVAQAETHTVGEVTYDFSPDALTLLDELLPLTVKTAYFQTYLDATTSEHVARMVAMKNATDNAEKMVKSLSLQYNRARQSQITTELSEIMGGVEAMG